MGEGIALDAAWLFAAVLVLIVAAAAVVATRRYWLERGGGTVECGLRRLPANSVDEGPGDSSAADGSSWRLGVVSYQRDELDWYGAFGVLLRPEHIFPRRSLEVVSRRPARPAEVATLGPGRVVIEVTAGTDGHAELAMTEAALTGFLAWLEAAPPGSHLDDL